MAAVGGSSKATPTDPPPLPVFKQPQPLNPNSLPFFSRISEDILVNVFSRLENDPRDQARLACVCRRFNNVIKTSCYRRHCMRVVPTVISELIQPTGQQNLLGEPPGGWGSLQKLLVCCPGLRHAGVLLECWDFGLEREIGSSNDYELLPRVPVVPKSESNGETEGGTEIAKKMGCATEDHAVGVSGTATDGARVEVKNEVGQPEVEVGAFEVIDKKRKAGVVEQCTPGVGDGKKLSTMGESGIFGTEAATPFFGKRKKKEMIGEGPIILKKKGGLHYHSKIMNDSRIRRSYRHLNGMQVSEEAIGGSRTPRSSERRRLQERIWGEGGGRVINEKDVGNKDVDPHLADGEWSLTREQGNKLLASRFRADSLYICDWPGCEHLGEKRTYHLFRGIFKNFKHSHVWRNLKDLRAKKSELHCAFCPSMSTWDMVTTFCLRRSFEYHEDGEPVVRAFVCENGHVCGAWTDRPLYNS